MALATVFAALEESMRNLVIRIAEGEGLDADELMHKYLGPDVKPAPVKKQRTAKVTVSEVSKCSAKTAKGKACSLKALDGMCFCRVHISKAAESDEPDEGSASVGPVKKKPTRKDKGKARATDEDEEGEDAAGPSTAPPKKKKKVRSAPPVHTHAIDDETHDDCELCHTHGGALNDTEETEFEMVVSPPRTLRERLVAAAAMTEEEDYDDE
jgi:hypothetical protein